MKNFITDELSQTRDTMQAMLDDKELLALMARIGEIITTALQNGNKILFAGNGGSAADAQHLATELVGKLSFDRPALAAFALTTDSSLLTAIGNDFGYENVFKRQVEGVANEGDVFIGISTSGRSKNLIAAAAAAKARGVVTVGLTGQSGGDMLGCYDYCLCVPSTKTPRIQEAHIAIGHTVCAIAEENIFGGDR